MKTKDGIGLLGGYAAKQCEEFVRKEFSNEYSPELKLDPSPVLQAMFESGNQFEEDIIDVIREHHADDPGVIILDGVEDRDDKGGLRAWAAKSMEHFTDPDVWFIVNPRLEPVPGLNLTGEPDAAIRGSDGGWHPVDVKDHKEMEGAAKATLYKVSTLAVPRLADAVGEDLVGKPQLVDSLQLAHYHRMFEAHGLTVESDEVWGAIIGRSRNLVWRQLDKASHRNVRLGAVVSPLTYYDVEQEQRRAIRRREKARRTLPLTPLSQPEWKPACKDCPWRQVCRDELTEMDDISLLPGMSPTRQVKYREAEVATIADLAKLDYPTAALTEEKIPVEALREKAATWPKKQLSEPAESLLNKRGASLQRATDLMHKHGFRTVKDLLKIDETTAQCASTGISGMGRMIDQARVQRVEKVHLARDTQFVGFDRARLEVDIDFEDHAGYTYMFGMLVSGRTKAANGDRKTRSEYRAYCSWDASEAGEAKAFAEFWGELMRLHQYARDRRYGFRAYHYTQHEVHAIKQLATRHEGKPGVPTLDEVTKFIDSRYWVDLYPIVSKDMLWPTKDYTVKSIAKYVRHAWSGDGVDGALSIVWYKEALEHPDPDFRKQRREELLTYNRQDNEATLKIREWITELSETQRRPGEKLPNVADLDSRFRLRP